VRDIEELKVRVRSLPEEDFSQFRDFFYQLEEERWDRQIEADSKVGKFDKLIAKAREEFDRGRAREL